MGFLDFIFPKRCVNCRKVGSYICTNCFSLISFYDSGICIVCQRASIDGLTHPGCRTKYTPDGIFSSLVYRGVVKKLVYKFKYKPNLTDLRSVMIDLFYEGIIQNEAFDNLLKQSSVLVPIPLHKSRFRKRGYNQAEILAKGIGKKLDIPVVDLLERVKNTKPQFGLKKDEREENIKDAFGIQNSEFRIQNFKHVFLVDDVSTSGATIKEAANLLKRAHSASSGQAGVGKVYGLTLAHGQ